MPSEALPVDKPAPLNKSDHTQLRTWIDLIQLLVVRDLRVRYRESFLGYLWSMMNPLLYMIIMTFVFSHLLRFQIENYSAFILSGILIWNLFNQSLTIGVNSIVANGSLLRKVKVPATLFPAASVCSVLVNFVLALAPYLLIALYKGVKLSGWTLLLPALMVPYLTFIFGLALLLATLNVRFRDVGHVMEPLLLMLFYGTPVFYNIDQLPEFYRGIIGLNPMTHFLRELRAVLFFGEPPSLRGLSVMCGAALLSLTVGALVYRSHRDRFVYDL